MPKIIDPDDLTYELETVAAGTANVVVDTAANRIELNVGGSLSDDGVTLQALYSKLKEIWKAEPLAIPYDFPMISIFNEQFEFVEDWELAAAGTVNLIRDAGFAYRNAAGTVVAEWIGFDSVFTLDDNDQATGDQVYVELDEPNGTVQNMYITGRANQPIQTYGDGTHGSIDYRSNDLRFFVREQGKLNGFSSVSSLQVPQPLTYKKYAFPLSNGSDAKITNSDATVTTTAPYTGMSIDVFGAGQGRVIGGTSRDFTIIIDGNDGTAEQIYEFVQYQLRQAGDIDQDNSHPLNGLTADALLQFNGDTLRTLQDRNGRGVYIDNFNANDTNRLEFTDDTGTIRTFPFVAAGSFAFNPNLVNDTDAKFWAFFTNDDAGDNLGYDFGTDNAILVHGNTSVAGTDITVTAASNTITSTTTDLSSHAVGTVIHLEGTASDDGYYEVTASAANSLTVQTLNETAVSFTGAASGTSYTLTQTLTGDIDGNSSISFDFDYDGNVQRGAGSAGVDAPITIVAMGLNTSQYVVATGTITRAVGQSFSLVAALERNYSNPA